MEFAAGAGAEPGSKPGQKTAAYQAAHPEAPAAGATQGGQEPLGGQQATQAKRLSKLEPAANIPDDLQGTASFSCRQFSASGGQSVMT